MAVRRREAHVQPQAVLALGEGVEGVEGRHHAGRHLARGRARVRVRVRVGVRLRVRVGAGVRVIVRVRVRIRVRVRVGVRVRVRGSERHRRQLLGVLQRGRQSG